MWILDTNLISELVAPRPAERVIVWVASEPARSLFTTAISEAEVFYGVEQMPAGRRRDGLRLAVEVIFARLAGQILPFDSAAARTYAHLLAQRRAAGNLMSQADAQIAAIALENKATLVTRNIRDVAGCNLELLNPWLA